MWPDHPILLKSQTQAVDVSVGAGSVAISDFSGKGV